MGGKKRKRKQTQLPPEDRRAEAVTVGWMLCVLATLGAELGGLLAWAFLRLAEGDAPPGPVRVLPALMLFTALIAGVVSLFLLALVHRFRRVAPPRAITAFAVLVALAPLAALLVFAWR